MTKSTLAACFTALLLGTTAANAQTAFTDDFESYSVGNYIGSVSPNWTTWSGTTGGPEDVQVVNNNSSSGTQSVYFSSTSSTGGPQDVVLPFGGQYNTGTFLYEMDMFVETNKGAYFNFQANSVIGQVWAIECYMTQTGALKLSNTDGTFLTTTYPTNQWFNIRFDINLNTNTWALSINNVFQGSFANTQNQIASIDIFPSNLTAQGGNNQSGFWVDDVAFVYTAYTLPALNGAAINIANATALATQQVTPQVVIRNLGTSPITSFDLSLNYNSGTQNQTVSSVNIASLATYTVTVTTPVTLVAGSMPMTATVSNVNGMGADGDASDDVKVITINPVVPAADKVVVVEEATGTWCGWCPRGAVFMDMMENKYSDFFAGVAVHNNDPMVHAAYDAAIGGLIAGYPSALIDRLPEIDPSAIEPDFLQRVTVAPHAAIQNGANWNATTRTLDVSLTYNFAMAANNNYKVACVLTEDNVTGTGSGYAQTNYYAGGSNGVMGGYETLPNPVPAAQMVYDFVARQISPSFNGYASAFPSVVNVGNVFTFNFTFVLPAGWDENEIHIIGMLIDPAGDIDNGSKTTIAEAVSNGYIAGTSITGITPLPQPDALVNVYPNPSNGTSTVSLNIAGQEEVRMVVRDVTGKVIADRNYGELSGNQNLPLDLSGFAKGMYLLQVTVGDQTENTRVVIE